MSFKMQLENLKAYRKDREQLAAIAIEEQRISELLSYCKMYDDSIAYKAAWTLEMVCIADLTLLYPHLDIFFDLLPKSYQDQAVRPFGKICEMLCEAYYKKKSAPLKKEHRERITEVCFDWLISNQKVACKAYAMQCLFYLGTEFDWIYPELKIILEKDFTSEKPAFKARARHILKKL